MPSSIVTDCAEQRCEAISSPSSSWTPPFNHLNQLLVSVVCCLGVYIPILPNDERYTAILDAPVPFMVGLPFDTRSSATSVDLSNNDGV